MGMLVIDKKKIGNLFELLKKEYKVIGPTFKDGLIVLSEIKDISDMPFGYISYEGKNYYAVERFSSEELFTYARASNAYKDFLHPNEFVFLKVYKGEDRLRFEDVDITEKYAFFDVRTCDLKAMSILDKVYKEDKVYKSLRQNLFIVGVSCKYPTDVCFCNSLGLSPRPSKGFDILLTELKDGILIEYASEKGQEFVKRLDARETTPSHLQEAKEMETYCISAFKKSMNVENLPEILYKNIDNPVWEEISRRCFSCGSCTQVCPTCFCFNIIDKNIDDATSQREILKDSCFNTSFATLHKFNIRASVHSRYRQWYMHKFAYWIEQFGEFGCVGCGRCISWCPAFIDITEKEKRMRGL